MPLHTGEKISEHIFLITILSGRVWVVDPTWQQFLSPEQWSDDLPKVLVADLHDLAGMLREYGVKQQDRLYWVKGLLQNRELFARVKALPGYDIERIMSDAMEEDGSAAQRAGSPEFLELNERWLKTSTALMKAMLKYSYSVYKDEDQQSRAMNLFGDAIAFFGFALGSINSQGGKDLKGYQNADKDLQVLRRRLELFSDISNKPRLRRAADLALEEKEFIEAGLFTQAFADQVRSVKQSIWDKEYPAIKGVLERLMKPDGASAAQSSFKSGTRKIPVALYVAGAGEMPEVVAYGFTGITRKDAALYLADSRMRALNPEVVKGVPLAPGQAMRIMATRKYYYVSKAGDTLVDLNGMFYAEHGDAGLLRIAAINKMLWDQHGAAGPLPAGTRLTIGYGYGEMGRIDNGTLLLPEGTVPAEDSSSVDYAMEQKLRNGGIDFSSLGFSVSEGGALDLDWPAFAAGNVPALDQLTPVVTGFASVESLPGLI